MVAGGTPAAVWKAELLSACGANVDVLGEGPGDEMAALAAAPPGGMVNLRRQDGLRRISLAPPLRLAPLMMTAKRKNLLLRRAPRACRSTSSINRRSATFPSVPLSTALHS